MSWLRGEPLTETFVMIDNQCGNIWYSPACRQLDHEIIRIVQMPSDDPLGGGYRFKLEIWRHACAG